MPDQKGTSYSDGFGIFNKISEEEFDVPNKNYLRLFMLNTENKLFTYDELYEYILPNVAKGGYTDKEAERNILSNPFKRFEDMNMMRHTKTLGIIEVDGTVWKKLSEEEKKQIEGICDAKLEEYYLR